MKSVVELKIVPVGPPGTLTIIAVFTVLPLPEYSVERFDPASAAQNGPVAEKDTPHGFLRFRSVLCASPGMSETRLVWTYVVALQAGGCVKKKANTHRMTTATDRNGIFIVSFLSCFHGIW